MKEVWRKTKFCEMYEVSNLGRIRSWKNRKGNWLQEPRFIKTFNNGGYRRIVLSKNGTCKKFLIHRLVANLFIPNPNNYKQINHKDGNKINNKAENLEWCSSKQNVIHSVKTQLTSTKLHPTDIPKIRNLFSTKTDTEIGKLFGVHRKTINDIKNNRTWTHI